MEGRFTILDKIGQGITATVYSAKDNATGSFVAIKRISKDQDALTMERVQQEIKVMQPTYHPFIVSFYEVFEDADSINIVMEYCQGGTIKDVLQSNGPLDEHQASVIMAELVLALSYVHSVCGAIHRDVKPDNILLDKHGHVRLCDFGFAKECDVDAPKKRSACGSPAFTAPEVIKRAEYTGKADVWGCGVVLYMLVFNKLPFQGQSIPECMRQILCKELEVPGYATDNLRDLLTNMLQKDWHKRFSFEQVLEHPWLKENALFPKIMEFNSAPWVIDAVGEDADLSVKTRRDRQVQTAMSSNLGSLYNGFQPPLAKAFCVGAIGTARSLRSGSMMNKRSLPCIKCGVSRTENKLVPSASHMIRGGTKLMGHVRVWNTDPTHHVVASPLHRRSLIKTFL